MRKKPINSPARGRRLKRVVMPRRRPTTYDRGQHELICTALKTSADPNAPGNTAYEDVCELLMNIDEALAAKTLSAAKKALKTKVGSRCWIRLYGTGEA